MHAMLCLALFLTAMSSAGAHAGHDHHHHDHDHEKDHTDHVHTTLHSDGHTIKHAKGHTHNCQHDAIEDMLKTVKTEYRAAQLAAIVAETGDADVHATVGRRLNALAEKRRRTNTYHSLRVTYDFSRLGTSTADLANGADTHTGGAKTNDFTCYEGGAATVPNSYGTGTTYSCTSTNKLTDEKRDFLKYTLLPQSKALLENALTVSDADQATSSPNVLGPCLNWGLNYNLPDNCDWDPVSTSERSVANSDFHLYITARPTDEGVIAWATTLKRDPTTNRPIAGVANFNPEYLEQPKCNDLSPCLADSDCTSGTCGGKFESKLGTAIHEIVHALGFSSSSWSQFNGKTESQVVEQKQVSDGTTRSFIITPNVIAKVKEQYGCSEDRGQEIENLGGGGTAGSHWEKRLVANEFMNPQVADDPILFSAITLGLFEDTGWYKPNYGAAQHLPWGYKQGCNFLKKTCGQGWDNRYFCDKEYADSGGRLEGCSSFDFRGRGYCDLATYSGALDNYYQYFSDPKLGGRESYMDYCPMYKPYSNTPCNKGSARNGNLRATYGEHSSMLNENGFCFAGTYQFGSTASGSTHTACHEVICAPDLQTYKVKFYDGNTQEFFEVECDTNGGLKNVGGTFSGKVECYPANLVCFVPTNCPKASGQICSGHGTCGSDLTCTCAFGYVGATCENRECPKGVGDEQCSGIAKGTCNTDTGDCNCASAYDGAACDRLKCPETTKAECNGNGACSNATWPGDATPAGQCVCTTGYTGTSCNRAPGCPDGYPTCYNHGLCDELSGTCACSIKDPSTQIDPLCPTFVCPVTYPSTNPVYQSLEECTSRPTDMKKCAYWTGLKCQQEIASFSRSTTIMNETGAIFPPEMNLGSKVYRDYEFSTSVQEYSFFEFDIEKPERDIAFVVTITDAGTDVDIFASQDVINPTASSSNGYKWIADDVNTATSKKEVLQICGAFGYSTDSEGRPVPRAGSAGGDTKCSKQDANVKQGKMYVGVLSHLNQLSLTQSTYKIEIKIDKCNPASCIAGNGDCDSSTGDCICKIYSGTTNPIWTGTDCSSPKCPSPTKGDNKGIPCSGNGDCVIGSKDILGSEDNKPFCMCHPGYKTINNTVCDLPVDNQRVPTQINAETVFSATGFTYSSSAVGNEGTSLALGKYQMYYVTFPEPFTAVTVNVTGKQAIDRDDSAVSVLSSGRPDMLVAATRGKALAPTFENIDLTSFDYDGWVTRDLESHDAIFRTTRPNEKWYITILSTAYARSALDYKIRIKGTAPTSTNAGDCSKLSWEYRTCSGGKGTCVVGQDSTPICTECKVDENKGAFSYVGKTCGQKVYPVPSYQLNDNTVSEDSKILQPGSVYTSGANFGPLSDSSSLEPGEWEYFVVDTRANYISLTFKMSIKNTLLVQNSGVLAPLMLIKSAAGGASLPSLDTDPNTFYDFEGAQIGEQLVTIENTDNVPIADRYYVAVYNQRYSGAALEYSLEITSRHPSTGVRVIRIPLVPFLFPDIYSSSFIIIELTFFYLNLLLVLFSFFFFLFLLLFSSHRINQLVNLHRAAHIRLAAKMMLLVENARAILPGLALHVIHLYCALLLLFLWLLLVS